MNQIDRAAQGANESGYDYAARCFTKLQHDVLTKNIHRLQDMERRADALAARQDAQQEVA